MECLMIFLVFSPILAGLSLVNCDRRPQLWRLSALSVALVLLASVALLQMEEGRAIDLPMFSGFGITFETNGFGTLYVVVAAVLWLVSILTSWDYFPAGAPHLNRYYAAILVALGGTNGIFLAGDLFTLFVFFEIMSFSSYLWVAHNQNEASTAASESYLIFGVWGGLSILFGLFLLYGLTPDLTIDHLAEHFAPYVGTTQLSAACLLLFLGFGAKAGAFFLHDWLPLAHAAAPAPASGLLSGLLTKAGVYGILVIALKILSGWAVFGLFLLVIALLNMLIGGFLALTSSNLKRVLAFSSVSQIGFILWGVGLTALLGEHGAIAAYGTTFHALNHSLVKILLFSLAGIVYQNTNTLDLNQLRGYGRGKPWLQGVFLVGAVAAAGIPGLSGYVSKTLLHESMVEYIHLYEAAPLFSAMEYLFLLAGGCTLAYMGKLYLCLFHEGEMREPAHYVSARGRVALTAVALAMAVLGLLPHGTFDVIGGHVSHFMGVHELEMVAYFSLTNLKGSLTSILLGLLLLFCERLCRTRGRQGVYGNALQERDTLEWRVYRPMVAVLAFLGALGARIFDILLDGTVFVLSRTAFAPLAIPESFYYGDSHEAKVKRTKIHITFSLAYSLLMFGMGFLFTIICLLVLGGRG